MTVLTRAARSVVGAASPRHRRYRRLLASCDLDPSTIPLPPASPGQDDVVVCGCPRSGTTLLAAAIHQPPAVVSVIEPWDGLRLLPAALFASLRHELTAGWLARGRLDPGALQRGDVAWRSEGTPTVVASDDRTVVAVKWPTFWQYLPLLTDTRFIVGVRHPGDVVASMAAQPGRLRQGLDYDVAFNRSLNQELSLVDDVAQRRLAFYDRVNATVLAHRHRANVMVVHHERWHHDRTALLAELSRFLDRELAEPAVTIGAPRPAPGRDDVAARSVTARALGY